MSFPNLTRRVYFESDRRLLSDVPRRKNRNSSRTKQRGRRGRGAASERPCVGIASGTDEEPHTLHRHRPIRDVFPVLRTSSPVRRSENYAPSALPTREKFRSKQAQEAKQTTKKTKNNGLKFIVKLKHSQQGII